MKIKSLCAILLCGCFIGCNLEDSNSKPTKVTNSEAKSNLESIISDIQSLYEEYEKLELLNNKES